MTDINMVMKKIASIPHHELFIADAEDVLIVVAEPGFQDTSEASRVTLSALQDYARKLGKKCGLVIAVDNLLAQEPESRRIYAEGAIPQLFFGIAMVVNSPVARIVGNLLLHMKAMQIPVNVVNSVEAGIAWLEANRKA